MKHTLVLISSVQSWITSSPGAKGLRGTDGSFNDVPVTWLALLSKLSWFGDEAL